MDNNLSKAEQNTFTEETGRVCAIQKNRYFIRFNGKEIPAVLKGSFRGKSAGELPLVGDQVKFGYNRNGSSVILSILDRKSLLMRPDQAKDGAVQYMVANADYAFIITSLNEDYSYNRIVRYALVALEGNVTPVAILTKSDLTSNPGRYIREVESISDKLKVHAVSAIYGIGLDELEEYLTPGTTICLLGSSGAGKSTLINSLAGKEIMKTAEIRGSDSEGRHTTTHRQLIELDCGVTVIDTPGMREIGVSTASSGLDDAFSDIKELESLCKFRDCRHETEPGCAIKRAIETGYLPRERYKLYLDLKSECVKNYAKKKQISKDSKNMKKYKDRYDDQ